MNPFFFSLPFPNFKTLQVTLGEGKTVMLVADVSPNPEISQMKIISGVVESENAESVTIRNSLGLRSNIRKSNIDLSKIFVQESLPNNLILNKKLYHFLNELKFPVESYTGDDALTNIPKLNELANILRDEVRKKAEGTGVSLTVRSTLQYLKPGDIIIGLHSEFFPGRYSDEVDSSSISAHPYQVLKVVGLGRYDGYVEVIAPLSVVMKIPLRELNQGYFLINQK